MKLFLYVEKHQHGEDTNVLVVLEWNSDQTLLTRILSNEFLACYMFQDMTETKVYVSWNWKPVEHTF